jgi:hypothetical protein
MGVQIEEGKENVNERIFVNKLNLNSKEIMR